MNVFIVGLGLIGASYAEKLSQAGFRVYGIDHDETVMQKAMACNLIDQASSEAHINQADLIICALYPKACINFFKTHTHRFNENQTLTDVAGIKTTLINAIDASLAADIGYLSHHPMAGKAISGIDARDANLFKGMNFLIVNGARTRPIDLKRLEALAHALEVGTVTHMNAAEHDTRIAFTSQLTHVLAASLMHSEPPLDARASTGDSFRDLTRIANINAPLWAELFTENAGSLSASIARFEAALSLFKKAILDHDIETLETLLNEAKARRKSYD